MADPSKLYAGATAVYGEAFMEANYGKLKPIEPSRIRSPGDEETVVWQGRPLKFLHTEGHAKHHFCIWDAQSENVFTGDTFGLSYREFDTEKGPFLFPTTTPIHFDPDALHRSIDRMSGPQSRRSNPHALFPGCLARKIRPKPSPTNR